MVVEDQYLGGGVTCPACSVGVFSAMRDGWGEVDGYCCNHCNTAVYLVNQIPNADSLEELLAEWHIERGSMCGLSGVTWWEWDDEKGKEVQ